MEKIAAVEKNQVEVTRGDGEYRLKIQIGDVYGTIALPEQCNPDFIVMQVHGLAEILRKQLAKKRK